MKCCYAVFLIAALSAAAPVLAESETIVISDTLAAHADTPKVKRGNTLFGAVAKWSIGDFVVVSSKGGLTTIRDKSDLFHTKSVSRSTQRFSFAFTNKATDTAYVEAVHSTVTDSLHSTKLGKGFYLGSEELVQDVDSFTAIITIDQDTTDSWTLLILFTEGEQSPGQLVASLSNGERSIRLSPVSSINSGGYGTPWTAMGFEFFEIDESLGAIQYRGGPFGYTFMAWMNKALDERMRLILAAAMTAVLELYI